ncbi:GNAT family acetyltransferase [Myxococcota bacterium]|nr:GNAT family acetyltransferase [Myxococcota bacterium]
MIIRKYVEHDRNGLIQLWSESFPDGPPHNDPSKVIEAKRQVDDQIFVADDKGKVVGACMAGYDGVRGWLYSVAVTPDQQRRGIGQKLIQVAMEALKDLGCVKVNLQIRASNHEVIAFYESLGFGIEERISMGTFLE